MKNKIMIEYRKAVKACRYLVARRLLQMLIQGDITLGIDDTDWQVEAILDRCGANLVYVSTRTGYATYRIARQEMKM